MRKNRLLVRVEDGFDMVAECTDAVMVFCRYGVEVALMKIDRPRLSPIKRKFKH